MYREIYQIPTKEYLFVVVIFIVLCCGPNVLSKTETEIKHDGSSNFSFIFHTIMHIIPAVKQTIGKVLTNFMTKKSVCVCVIEIRNLYLREHNWGKYGLYRVNNNKSAVLLDNTANYFTPILADTEV